MKPKTISRRTRQGFASMAIAISLLFTIATISLAGWVTIDTNDQYEEIDANWASVTPVYQDTTNDAGVDDRDEIKMVKFTFDGDAMYFLMQSWHGADILSSDSMRAIAALDCNNNGTFNDADDVGQTNGDRLIIRYNLDQVMIYDGGGNNLIAANPDWGDTDGNQTEWQAPLKNLPPGCRGTKAPIPIAFSIVEVTGGSSTTLSQTDVYQMDNPIDFGDAPNTVSWDNQQGFICDRYDTKLPCDGPRHGVTSLQLGPTIDSDGGELADDPALADDTNYDSAPDDEDGVAPSPAITWTAGGTGSLDVNVTGGSGYLNCWIDWDRDETFETGEQVITDQALSAGDHTINVNVPASVAFDGPYMARCRLSPNPNEGTTPTGPVYGGEVEDHDWLIQPVDLSIAINGSNVDLSWTHLSQNDAEWAYKSTTPYFDRASASALGTACTSGSCTVSDTGVVGGTPNAFYYKAYGEADVSGTTIYSTPSKEVGLFEFELVPGTN